MSRKTFLFASMISAVLWPTAISHGQTGGAVLNKAGIPVKLITTETTRLHAEADASSASSPCPIFKFWYVLPPDRTAPSRKIEDLGGEITRNGFYRVASGDSEGEFRGWIAGGDAVEWHHRQAVKFAPRQGRELARFFADAKKAKAATASGDLQAATHKEPEASGGELILMPVLDMDETEIDGQEMQLYQMAFLAGHPETAPPPPSTGGIKVDNLDGVVTAERVRQESTVDLVFVVDTTESMNPVIEQVRRSIRAVTEELRSDPALAARLRFGLVAYRDRIADMSRMEYVAKVFCDLEQGADHQTFLRLLDQLTQARVGSGGYPEDGLAGINLAMDLAALKWNPLAWKKIVTVGDASWKEPDHPDTEARQNQGNLTLAGLLAKAQPGGPLEATLAAEFMFYGVRVLDPRAAADHFHGDRQAAQLIHGRSKNRQGELIKKRGGSQPEDFSATLTKQIMRRLSNFQTVIVEGKSPNAPPSSPSAPKSAPTTASNSSAADFPWPVMEVLLEVGASGGPVGTAGMQFSSSYSTEFDVDGNRLFVPHLFVRKGQLKSFTAMLEFLQGQLEDAGEPGNRDVVSIVRGLQTLSTTLNISEPIGAEMPVDIFLSLLLGFPIKNPIFQLTIADLAGMSQTDYDDWVKSVKAQKDALEALTENPHIWTKLHEDASDRDFHAFVPLSDLP